MAWRQKEEGSLKIIQNIYFLCRIIKANRIDFKNYRQFSEVASTFQVKWSEFHFENNRSWTILNKQQRKYGSITIYKSNGYIIARNSINFVILLFLTIHVGHMMINVHVSDCLKKKGKYLINLDHNLIIEI